MAICTVVTMPLVTAKHGAVTRWTLKPKHGALSQGAALLLGLLLVGVFGPGFLAAGSLKLEVTCTRGEDVRCHVREGYLFGLLGFERDAASVTGVVYTGESDGETAQGLALTTTGGQVPLASIFSSINPGARREVVEALRQFFAGTAPELRLEQGFFNLVAAFGLACSLPWVLMLWGLLALPLHALRPAMLELDSSARELRVRLRSGKGVERLPAAGVEAVTLTKNFGGLMGKVAMNLAENQDPKAPDAQKVPHHLELARLGAPPLFVVNGAQLGDDEMQQLRDEVARAIGVR